jgi:CBS domain containing-hemolysin-like protein
MSLLLALAFLLGNAFFVGAQFALITARRDQIEPLAKSGNRAARTTLAQIRDLSRMLAGSQLGIAACSLGLGAVAEPAIAHLLENGLDAVRLPADLLHPIAFLLALALVSFCHMVLGEMVPKNLALAGPVDAALILGPPMAAWVWVTRPILLVINGLANALLKLIKVEPADELGGGYTADELTDVIAESAVVDCSTRPTSNDSPARLPRANEPCATSPSPGARSQPQLTPPPHASWNCSPQQRDTPASRYAPDSKYSAICMPRTCWT